MKALTYRGPRDVGYDDVPDPTPTEDGAVVRVDLAGICGSDLHIYEGHGFSPEPGYCVGHEAVGEVVALGLSAHGFTVGDRVLVPASTGCGSCAMCVQGFVGGCERGEMGVYGIGLSHQGSQAEYVAVPRAHGNLAAIPEGVSDEQAVVLTDAAATGWYGARRGRVAPGETVAVIGLGPVGLMAAQAAFAMGAARVLGVDLVEHRRAKAATLGIEPVDAETATAALPDVVIEAVGPDATVLLALQMARPRGRVSIIGVNQSMELPFPMMVGQIKELEMHVGLASVQRELPHLLALTSAGRLDPAAVITHRMPLSEGAEAYRVFADRLDGVGKVVLVP